MQQNHPIAYFSKKIGPHLQAASTYQRELHAIVEAIYKWRQYLLGRPFVIRTDHKSLRDLLQQVIHNPIQQYYTRKLLRFDFVIEYKAGKTNKAADVLSRLHEDAATSNSSLNSMIVISFAIPSFIATLKMENESLPDLLQLHSQHRDGSLPSNYSIHDGIVYFKGKYFLSPHSSLKDSLMLEFHATPLAGHMGIKRTLVRLASNFHWVGMRKDVVKFVSSCLICQQIKHSTQAPTGYLQPLPIPDKVWSHISMDFIVSLPLSRGYTVILVVVDRLTKFAHFGTLPTNFTATSTADLFVRMVVKLHGFPDSIVSDRDSLFLSKFWQQLFKLSGTSLSYSSAYYPQTDGQTEVVNRELE